MGSEGFFTLNAVIATAVFSLLWFIVGIAVGIEVGRRRLAPVKASPGSKVRRPKPEGGRSKRFEMYVGNLPYDAKERQVSDLFRDHVKVVSVRIIKNRGNGRSKGYGFVEVKTDKHPDAVIKTLGGMEMGGRKLVINEAKSKSRDDDD